MATVVDYSIYLEHASGGEEKKSFSTNKQVELLRLAAGITKGYLWQRDRFCLRQQNCSVLGLGKDHSITRFNFGFIWY